MANPTTNYGFVMPTPTDLVTDLPADFGVFGQAVDTQMKTNADAATQKATLTTKGDIYAATGTSTPARLAVGANDTVLTADSTTATGLKWAAAAAAGSAGVYLTKPTAGSTYYLRSGNSAATSSTVTGNLTVVSRTYYVPIMVSTCTATKIALRTDGNFAGVGVTMRLGIYNNDPTLNIPTTVLVDGGQVSPTASSTAYEVTISQALTAGLYYLAVKINGWTSGSNTYLASPSSNAGYGFNGFWHNSANNVLQAIGLGGYQEDQAAGALATAGTLTNAQGLINLAIGY